MIEVRSLPPIVPGAALGPGEVDLWCFFHEGASLGEYESLMTDDERARHRRYHFERDRDTFLATRALVRAVLSHYAEVAPPDWRFGAAEAGKPFAVGSDIAFNLTNTSGLVACAVAGGGAVGVDAERIDHRGDLDAVARRFFSPREAAATHDLERFFEIWTLKESYLKARGVGLGLPLDQFWFELDAPPRIHFESGIDDDPRRWQFASLRVSPQHILAVAGETNGAPLRLRASRIVPLRGAESF